MGKEEKTAVTANRKNLAWRKKERRLWANLPTDLLYLIMGRLHFVDQVHFRAVCKSWQMVSFVKSIDKLPWLMAHKSFKVCQERKYICKLCHPSFKQTHINKKMKWKDRERIAGTEIWASKFGWLLLHKNDELSLYSPLNKTIVKLPHLYRRGKITFSSAPTSSDCIVFLICKNLSNDEKIEILVCRVGDKKWSRHEFDGIPNRTVKDVVCSNGVFYCVFSGGMLWEFSVACKEWRMVTTVDPMLGVPSRYLSPYQFDYPTFMAESNGELWLICKDETGFSSPFHIFKFDWSQSSWMEKGSLGDRALFLGCTSFCVSATGEARNLADRVYFHGNRKIQFYSLKSGKYENSRSEFSPRGLDVRFERVWLESPHV